MALAAPDPRASDRAEQLWEAMSPAITADRRGRLVLLDRPGGQAASLWPYSQALHAAVLLSHLRRAEEPLLAFGAGLRAYRLGAAYQPRRGPWPALRFVDDNAWVGLASAHAALLGTAGLPAAEVTSRVARWVARHQAAGGGVRWREWSRGLHACSTGAVGLLALRAADSLVGADLVARRCAGFLLGRLRRPDGLVADNVREEQLDPTVWAYNQGLAIGLLTLLHARGDAGSLGQASELADTCITYFDVDDRLWRQPPCFVAVLGRMLLLLHGYDGDPRWVRVVDEYLDRVWEQTAGNGFQGAGLGAYDQEHSLDLAGLAVLVALRASSTDELKMIC